VYHVTCTLFRDRIDAGEQLALLFMLFCSEGG